MYPEELGFYASAWVLMMAAMIFAVLGAARSLGADGLAWERGGHWVAAAVIGLAVGYEVHAAQGRMPAPLSQPARAS